MAVASGRGGSEGLLSAPSPVLGAEQKGCSTRSWNRSASGAGGGLGLRKGGGDPRRGLGASGDPAAGNQGGFVPSAVMTSAACEDKAARRESRTAGSEPRLLGPTPAV